MFTTLICMSALAFSPIQQSAPLTCAIAPEPVVASAGTYDFAGSRYGFCCPGCPGSFQKDPNAAIAEAIKSGRTIGESLYDPVSGVLFTKTVKKVASVDFKSTRFHFSSEANKAKFEADPMKYGIAPKKEALYCAVMKHAVKSYDVAGAYADFEGVRYYFCCPNCLAQFNANPTEYAKNAAQFVMAPKATKTPKATP